MPAARSPGQGGRRSTLRGEHDSLAHFAAIVAHSDDAIVSKDLDGFILTWNAGAERIFGYAAAEIIGRSVLVLIPAELRDEEAMILGKIRVGERIEHYETERMHKDGTRVAVSLSISPIRDDTGHIVGASKIARDISERRHAESLVVEKQRLLMAEAHGLALLNDWSTRLWRCSAIDEGMGTILDAMIELLQADMGSIQLREGSVLRFAAQRGLDQAFLDVFREVSARDESGCGRAMRLRQRIIIADTECDSAYEPYREAARRAGYRTVVSTPFLTGSEEVLGVVTVQFRHLNVPSDAALRRMDLCARQASDFIQRCRMEQQLRDTDTRKDNFLALLAHELRNPLAPVRSGVQLLKMQALDPGTRMQAVAMLDRQVEHMTRLVDDLLDASRIGRGKITLQRKPIDLTSVLLQAIETSRPLIDAAGHRLSLEVRGASACVDGDPVRLTQVFVNLLNNSAKYTPRGGVISIELDHDAENVVISVRDTGQGIAPDMLDRVFDLFTQAEDAPQTAQGGLGIGLSLVRSLVQMHGGTVHVSSEGLGHGSCFTVRLTKMEEPCASDARNSVRAENRRRDDAAS